MGNCENGEGSRAAEGSDSVMRRGGEQSAIGLRTKLIGLLTAVLVVISAVFLVFTYDDQARRAETDLLEKSRVLVTEMDAVWDFISLNQSVINYTAAGDYDYKGLHCAIAGKSVAALFSEKSDYSIRFTNLNPRNIYNTPDAYEAAAIEGFLAEGGPDEAWGFETEEDQQVFRYVRAMDVSEDCIECHGEPAGEIDATGYPKEGWKAGDVAGAVSVVVPADTALSNMRDAVVANMLFFLAVVASMALIIYIVISRLITEPLTALRSSFSRVAGGDAGSAAAAGCPPTLSGLPGEGALARADRGVLYSSREVDGLIEQYHSMARRLEELYGSLESQVAERTDQLSRANAELERQRRRMEEINERLARDNQYKSDFLAIVSHELRTPLTSILAFADLLAASIDPDNAEAARQLEEIDKNGAILLEMVDNVLECARIQAGSETLNVELVDLSDLVGMVESAMEPVARKKDVAFSMRVDPDVPLIMGDWEKLRRVLANLTSNAVKFTEPGGAVTVRVRAEAACPAGMAAAPGKGRAVASGEGRTAASGGGRAVVLEVADTGIGIPAEAQELIFERFRQENMSTVRRYGGSGLGLSLVKDLVAMMGGAVSVESEPGRGSRFSVVLPLEEEDVHD